MDSSRPPIGAAKEQETPAGRLVSLSRAGQHDHYRASNMPITGLMTWPLQGQ